MFKVLIWDYIGTSAQWTDDFLRKDAVEIIRTLHPNDNDQAEVVLRGEWNFLLIFERGTREIFNDMLNTMRAINFSTENIIFAGDFLSWLNNPLAVYALLKPSAQEIYHRYRNFYYNRDNHRYIAATAEGMHYVGTSADNGVILPTYIMEKNHVSDDMKRFHALSKKYYGTDDGAGYFLDLGANIGTTGLYFIKKLAPNLKLLAFEPDAENFKMLRVNLILNDMEDKATIVNCGLGDKFDEMTMYRDLGNPGHNNVTEPRGNVPTETIKIMPLDAYLAEHKIAAHEVKYIWIDTEGFEAQVLFGAKNLLAENLVPVFMEFNPMVWSKTGNLDRLIDFLKTVGYTHYIWTRELKQFGAEKLNPLERLREFKDSTDWIGSLDDIFLVRADNTIS